MTNQAKDNEQARTEAAEDPNVKAFEENAGEEAVSEEDVLVRLAKENEELKERALRLAAEMENLRKRTARDVTEARSYSIAGFARDMLTVSDNLRRALEAVPAEARATADSGLSSLMEGVEMTERSMLSTLERHGVKQIDPKGERFDPHFHQAMFEVPDPATPENTVVQVVQQGYVIGERVLRPAMVGVAKGGPKAGAVQNGENVAAEPGPPNPQAERDA
ncbi:nucleotide exchange factor GrpE [Nitratireductor rhodophyticola]|uniref:Protein GrpE n=2 Tax=Nitratireductor TaxID=245876 RepID=A0A1H4LG48_9HYPH|nr:MULTISPECIES: nucleotide exchange factor GrpE [Nitratireductor]MBY8917194.1 nucleotide exchange factor GrpE [Nitratireductor rhodophyticola]MEC9246378.1 nucleotide exchange factor GrpE [Pseudomonadota bacterium]MBY8920377.1 nucleotide exchange factor GrpE [Nitratireductor rhodophyticola]WPZ14937.1 nucleotide exchange factor GrpE [Nitratireductor rhodophyticola]SEB69498.1 molecular chaperone GrpE [Nitratireductor aquibiodomus]